MEHDRRLGHGGEVAIARDVIGVRVRFEDPGDAQAFLSGQAHVLVDAITARVDDGGFTGLAASDQVGQAPRILVDELLEDHRPSPALGYGTPNDRRFAIYSR